MSFLGILFVLLGLAVFFLVATQASLALATSVKQYIAEREQRELGLKLLKNKIEAMKALYIEQKEARESTWSGFRKFKVKTKKEAKDVTSAYLYPHDGKKLPPFKPGQYLTFQLRIPGEDKPIIRCYSLSDSPNPEYYRVSVKKVPPPRDKPELPPGKSSTYFNDILKDDDILDVKAPAGPFFLEPRETFPVVLIGGGIGITPVFSMLQALVDTGNSEREIWFFYGVRTGREAIYKEVLKEIARKHVNVRMKICFSDPEPSDKEGEDYQHGERVSVDLFKRLLPSNNYDFYICGPPPMMQTLVPDLEKWGVPEKKIHFEAFGPATVKKKKPAEETVAVTAGPAVKLKFSQSNKELDWNPKFETILEFAEENGINMSSGCRIGNCGTCMVAVKSGEFSCIKEPSFAADAGTCLACVSAPKGNLEIDA